MATPTERAGVVRDEATGELIIPGTQRPDGTWRKPRRVKDGYIPQDEVPVYESKGMQFVKSKPDYPIGLSPDDIEKLRKARQANQEDSIVSESSMSKAAKKNAKRKEKKKQQQSDPVEKAAVDVSKISINSQPSKSDSKMTKDDIVKKVKKLKKTLRQIEDLEEKINSGQLVSPDPDQLGKIKRKQVVIDEIEDLELDLDD